MTFFFVLSGFVLTWSWRPEDRPRSFYLRRFARVYPVHLLTALVALVLALMLPAVFPAVNPAAVAFNLTLTQAWLPWETTRQDYVLSLNGLSWSLSDEVFFYAVFPLVIGWAMTRRRSPAILVVGASAYLVAVGALFVATASKAALFVDINSFPVYRIGEFLVGMGLALMVRRGVRLRVPVWAAVTVAVISYCLLWPINLVLGGLFDVYFWAPGVAMVPAFGLAIMAAASRDASGGRGILSRHFLVKLGQWSFALYMVHWLMFSAARPVVLSVDGPLRALFVVGIVALAVLVAAALYEWYERPIERRIRSWGHQRESVIAQA